MCVLWCEFRVVTFGSPEAGDGIPCLKAALPMFNLSLIKVLTNLWSVQNAKYFAKNIGTEQNGVERNITINGLLPNFEDVVPEDRVISQITTC